MNEFLEYALKYADLGLAVFPLVPRDKKPIVANGFKNATTDKSIITNWWKTYPNANIGIACGQISGGLVVVDMDEDEDKDKHGYHRFLDWVDEHELYLPDSWQSITGKGGYHLMFKSSFPVKSRVGWLKNENGDPEVDTRADGGYIVAPPSIHPNGNRYEWEYSPDEINIASGDEDEDVFFLFNEINKEQKTDYSVKYKVPDVIPGGSRHDHLFKTACSMQAQGFSDEAIRVAILEENRTKCNPPDDEKTVLKTIESVLSSYPKGKKVPVGVPDAIENGWREPVIKRNEETGKAIQSIENMREFIEFDEELFGKIKWNQVAFAPFVIGELPWDRRNNYREWNNFDDSALCEYMQRKHGFSRSTYIEHAFNNAVFKHQFNPIADMLKKNYEKFLQVGGSGYVRKLLPKYMGAEDSEYNYWAMKIFMRGAIARALHPGSKFDYVLTLHGKQGTRKSTFFRFLARDDAWFSDSLSSITDGDKAAEKLRGMWIIEMGELLAIVSAKQIEGVKAFLTSQTDNYRAPYARRTEQRPRTCVFAGTTNSPNFLRDKTGNRRWLVVDTSEGVNLFDNEEEANNDFDLAWGEAMDDYIKHSKEFNFMRLPKKIEEIAEATREQFSTEDPNIGIIASWLEDKQEVCVVQILKEALGKDKYENKDVNEIHAIMSDKIPGWKLYDGSSGHKKRMGVYGIQKCYVKIEDEFYTPTEDGTPWR